MIFDKFEDADEKINQLSKLDYLNVESNLDYVYLIFW